MKNAYGFIEVYGLVTGIETAGLRRTDRELLRGGITVGSQEQLLLLLEDLGS